MKRPFILLFILLTVTLTAQEVEIKVDTCTIKGTLEIPQADHTVTAALIIAGSGPTNRDGNNPLAGNNNAYKMLADTLLKNGIASLRYDKRAIGESSKVNESELLFDTYINDAVEWVKFLKADERISDVVIIGHSEGSLVGMVAAQQANVSKYISLCGAGKPIDKIVEEQVLGSKQMSEEYIQPFKDILDSLRQGKIVENINPAFMMLFRPSVQPYLISWIKYDPAKEISKLSIPVLVIGGTTDLQIKTDEAKILTEANSKAKLAIIENMNHILKNVSTTDRMANLRTYSDPELPLSKELCKEILEFIKQ